MFRPWVLAILLVAVALAYANSFAGVFLLDDPVHIRPEVLSSFPGWTACLSGTRSVVHCTLVADYARAGLTPSAYHLTNLVIHALASLALFGLLRRGLRLWKADLPGLDWIAFATTALWALHPLQTESVTYVIQRAEALVSLFYLVTLYAALRRFDGGGPIFSILSVLSALLGMCSKQVMVTAPLAVLLLDRSLVSGSFIAALRRRPGLYLGLFATLGWLYHLLDHGRVLVESGGGAGLVGAGVTPFDYLLAQGGVLLHYLRLTIWPHPLCLDYRWLPARNLGTYAAALAVLGLVGLALVGAWRKRGLGLVAILFFIILAPTSSVLPLADLAVEHRMYLALAAPLLLLVIAAWRAPKAALQGSLAVAVVLGAMTHARNRDYGSALSMYAQTARVRPDNDRAQFNLANELATAGRHKEAIAHYRRAIALHPSYVEALGNLALSLFELGDLNAARVALEQAIALDPTSEKLLVSLAFAHAQTGDVAAAARDLERALAANPRSVAARTNLGGLLMQAGRLDEAKAQLEQALAIDPADPNSRRLLGLLAQARQGAGGK